MRGLASLAKLTQLAVQFDTRNESEPRNKGLVIALCELPRLQHLDIITFNAPTAGFWLTMPRLREDMTQHQADSKQQVHIRIHAYVSPSIVSDEYWLSALRASFHCSELTVNFGHASDAAWQAFVTEAQTPPSTSSLQSLNHEGFSCALRNQRAVSTVNERFVTYCKLHTSLNRLHLGAKHGLCDSELKTLLSCLLKLTDLSVACPRPLVLQQALTTSKSLANLQRFIIPCRQAELANTHYLSQLLQLVNAATSLTEVAIEGSLDQWHDVSVQNLRACTQHVRAVHLSIGCNGVLGDVAEQLSTVEAKLRLLPNLISLDDAEYFD